MHLTHIPYDLFKWFHHYDVCVVPCLYEEVHHTLSQGTELESFGCICIKCGRIHVVCNFKLEEMLARNSPLMTSVVMCIYLQRQKKDRDNQESIEMKRWRP